LYQIDSGKPALKNPRPPSITASALARSVSQRLVLAIAMLAVLWLAIVWAVAIP
jgi:hypothetical protein